jgi:hypothetical protein
MAAPKAAHSLFQGSSPVFPAKVFGVFPAEVFGFFRLKFSGFSGESFRGFSGESFRGFSEKKSDFPLVLFPLPFSGARPWNVRKKGA